MIKEEQQYLLQLARRAIQKYLQSGQTLLIEPEDLSPALRKKSGVFVTLEKDGQLRGCIGNLQSSKTIYQGVIDNSLSSAFFDPRFPSLTIEEFPDIKIEISVLEPLKKLAPFSSSAKLLNYLNKNKPGLLIKKGNQQATFLPQVWEELPDAELFLQNLCQKASLDQDNWKKPGLEFYEYNVEKFKE